MTTIDATDARLVTHEEVCAIRYEQNGCSFKSQRGEATHQEWLDKVTEIKARYPS